MNDKIEEIEEFEIPDPIDTKKKERNKKKLVFDSKKYNFKCLQCGTCCSILSASASIGSIPSFNHKGAFVKKPKGGVVIYYFEIDEMRQNLTQEQLSKIHPATVIFLKNHPVGFVAQYQIGYNKYGHCSFFNFKTKRCNIYNFRPLVCRIFPITIFDEEVSFNLNAFNKCKAFHSEIAHQNSISTEDIAEDIVSQIELNEFELGHSFPSFTQEKLKIYHKTFFFKNIVESFSDMIISPEQITPNIVKKYKLLDLKGFTKWFKANIKNKELLERLSNFEGDLMFFELISNAHKDISKLASEGLSKEEIESKIDDIIKQKLEKNTNLK